jgi:hypothetical protein
VLLLSGDSPPALLVLGMGIVGCGLGLSVPPGTAVIMNDLGHEKAGDGAGVNQLARQVGGARDVAIVGSVFAPSTPPRSRTTAGCQPQRRSQSRT